jgi:hypothetical protein
MLKPSEPTSLLDELWAVLHGMAVLYLDRSAAFDVERAQDSVGTTTAKDASFR